MRERRKGHALFGALLFGGASALVAALGRRFTPDPSHPEIQRWYGSLEKSPLTPPDRVFGPVWGTLWVLLIASGVRVWNAPDSRERTRALWLWAGQQTMNGIYSPLFFGAKQKKLAALHVAAQVGIASRYAWVAGRVDRAAGWLAAPHVAWIAFATVLAEEVARRNPENERELEAPTVHA